MATTTDKNRFDIYATPTASPEAAAAPTSLVGPILSQVAVVLRERGWFLGAAVVVGALVLFAMYPREVTYTSSAIFMSEAQRNASPATSIAAQIGILTPGQFNTTSPQFYLELIRTPRFLEAVVDARVPSTIPGDTATRTIAELLGFASGDPRAARQNAAEALSYQMSAEAMGNTGMVRLQVTASSARLAQAVTDAVLKKIGEFNLQTRQSRANAERQFVERRVGEVSAQLREVEDRLQRFLIENRDFSRAPALQFDYGRLQRELALRQSLFASLSQSYEQARIEEVRDTPVITIVSPPEEPLRRDPLGRLRILVVTMLVALGAGWAAANIRDQLRHDKAAAGSGQVELMRLASELRQDLRERRIREFVLGRSHAAGNKAGNGNPRSPD